MSRVIKFRSWNEEEKVFYYFFKGLVFDCPIKIKEYNHVGGNNFYKFNWDNSEQFTGLKDKNGKEIYEGDVVVRSGKDNCIVEWRYDKCKYDFKYKVDLMSPQWMGGIDNHYSKNELEVIGNIHEKTNKNG